MADRKLPLLTVKDFKKRVANGDAPGDVMLFKDYVADQVKIEDKRRATFVVSTGAVDRDHDVVKVDGWQLDDYRKNPVILFAHKSEELPVARSESIGVGSGVLKSHAAFPEEGTYPFADTVYGLLKGGFLRAVSAGFRPVEYEPNAARGGMDFTKHTLMEYSVVPIPSNPEALLEAKAAGIPIGPMVEWCTRMLDSAEPEGLIAVPKVKIERALAILDGGRKSFLVSLPTKIETTVEKVGRVLSTANEQQLRAAVQALEAVLAQLQAEPQQTQVQPQQQPNAQPGEGMVQMAARALVMLTKTPPWKVEPRGGKHVVVGVEDGKEYGEHATPEEAEAQVAALYAQAKPSEKEPPAEGDGDKKKPPFPPKKMVNKQLANVEERDGMFLVVLANGEVLQGYDVKEKADYAANAINSAAAMADSQNVAPGAEPGAAAKISPNEVILKLTDVDSGKDPRYHIDEPALREMVSKISKSAINEFRLKALGQLPD